MGEPILTGFDLQLLLSLGLFLLSWGLHKWLERREYFLWWTFAWGALVVGMVAQRIPSLVGLEAWAGAAQLVASPFALLQATFFLFGAWNLHTGHPVTRERVARWIALSVVVGLGAGVLSMLSAEDPDLLRAYRGAPRQLALAVVLPYCAFAFSGSRHREGWGTGLTMLGFLGYGINQALYGFGSIEILVDVHFGVPFPAPTDWILNPMAFALDIFFEASIGAGAVLLLIDDHREARAILAASESRFRTAFEGAPIGVAVLDEEIRLMQANPLLKEMFALDPDFEAQRPALSELATGSHRSRLEGDLQDLVSGDASGVDGEYRFRRRDGGSVWARVRAARVRTASGGLQVVLQARDVTERRALERSRRELTALVERSGDFIALNDRTRIRYLNPAGCRMVGLEAGEAEGRSTLELVETEEPDALWAEVEEALAEEGLWSGELWLRDLSGGASTPVSATLFQIQEKESGNTVGTGAICRDITERKRAEAELLQAKEEAEAANQAKSEFLATMSHEIRTPMNAIIGMAELLNETELTPEQRDYVQVFSTAGDTLLTLINEILDLSKMEAGHLSLEAEPFRLRELIERTVELYAVPAHRKGLEIAGHVEPDVPEWVSGDSGRLRQVLANLVGNAVKFTEEGEVVVEVEALEVDDESVALRVNVRDTGVGIPADEVGRIFERFTQVDSSTTRRFEGTGLGLTISHGIVELMGGRIWAESEEGVGSNFRFEITLPVVESGPDDLRPPDDAVELTGLQALVVDDNATNRLILSEMLSAWGLRPTSVPGGREAVDELMAAHDRGGGYDLVLLDAHMPGMDGFEVAGWIRGEEGLSDPTVMMLTSGGYADDVERVRSLGLGSYLVKPVRRARLLEAIRTTIATESPRSTADREERTPASREDVAEGQSTARVLLVEDQPENRMLVEAYLKPQGYDVDTAVNGDEAVQKVTADGERYDILLMDMRMPVMDGYEATRRIREWEEQSGRPRSTIVALTAHALEEERQKTREAGCDEHLTKPIKKKELLDALDDLVAGRRGGGQEEEAHG